MTALVAYDYDLQVWVQGEAARPLLRKQINETLAVLRSPQAEHYLATIANTFEPAITPAKLILRLERQLEELEPCKFCVTAAQYRPGARCEMHR